MKEQEKADPSCLGSLLLKTTKADQFDEAPAEHLCIMDVRAHLVYFFCFIYALPPLAR